MSETKNVLQPVLASAPAIGSIPQPYALPLTTAAHSAAAYLASFSQLDTIAVRSILRTPHASASAGPSVVTQAACALLLTTSLPPLFTIFPSTEPSTTTFAPDSIVKLPRRFPRMCKEQFC